MFLAQGVMRAGLLMMANPLVAAIVLIGVVIAGVAYVVYRNWDRIKQAFSSALSYIGGLIDGLPGWAKMLMALNPAGLALLVWRNWDRIKQAFGDGVAAVKGFFTGLPGWMASMGSAMMTGLLNALNPFALRDRLLSIAKAGISAFKNFFGIKSPSRLFMAMGGHMTQGLAHGIDAGARAPMRSVGRLGTGVAGAAAFSLAAPGMAAAGANVAPAARSASAAAPITIHIHQQPGEDADALAERVMRKLDQRGRRERLSSYADDF